MFKLNLVLRRKNDDIMIFSPAPWFRFVFLAIAAFIIIGIITIASEGNGNGGFTIPIVLSAICVIASLYEESWIFNRKEQRITSKTGLLLVNKIEHIPFEAIEKLEFVVFIRGGRTAKADMRKSDTDTEETETRQKRSIKKYCQILRLNLKSNDSIEIETAEGYNTDILKQKAWILSDFCGFELIQ